MDVFDQLAGGGPVGGFFIGGICCCDGGNGCFVVEAVEIAASFLEFFYPFVRLDPEILVILFCELGFECGDDV